MSRTYADIATLLAARIPRRNPIIGAVIVADLGLVNGTQTVLAQAGGATWRVIYLAPLAVQVPGNIFITRAGRELTAPYICYTTNYQVPPGGGIGVGAWGGGDDTPDGGTPVVDGSGATGWGAEPWGG